MKHPVIYHPLSWAVVVSSLIIFTPVQCIHGNSTGNSTGGLLSDASFDNFMNCSGLQEMNRSVIPMETMKRMKGVMDNVFDLYSFTRTNSSLQPLLELMSALNLNTVEDGLHDTNFTRVWFRVKLEPRLPTVSKWVLSCLSAKNFTCETYQTVVNELDKHMECMEPVRQKMIYEIFMHAFLARNDTAGCCNHGANSEQWLLKNFQSFSTFAPLSDFYTLNSNFNGMAALRQLSPEQSAELVFHPDIGDMNNGTINPIFDCFIQPLMNNERWNYSTDNYTDSLKSKTSLMRPLGSFIMKLVYLVNQENHSSLCHRVTQATVNWTLQELGGCYNHNFTVGNELFVGQAPTVHTFNISCVHDWFRYVVVPVMRCTHQNTTGVPLDLTDAFYDIFSFHETPTPPYVLMDTCEMSHFNHSCPRTTDNFGVVLKCMARSNISLTTENLRSLATELSMAAECSPEEHLSTPDGDNFTDMVEWLPEISFRPEELDDPDHMEFWFSTKLKRKLPYLSEEYLTCISRQNFSCDAFHALVKGMSDDMMMMPEMNQQLVYSMFIYPFLTNLTSTDIGPCSDDPLGNLDFITQNFGQFSAFASLQHFFDLSMNFSVLEALPVLTPGQIADLILQEHHPQDSDHIINSVFDHLDNDTRFTDFLFNLLMEADRAQLSCESFNTIIYRLNQALSSAHYELAAHIRNSRDALMMIAPEGCTIRIPMQIGCSVTPVNESLICNGVNTTALEHYLSMNMTHMLRNMSLQHFACLPQHCQLSPEQLCRIMEDKMSCNHTITKEVWKLFFTRFSAILDAALQMFSSMPYPARGPHPMLSMILDVLQEVILDQFTAQDLRDPHFIRKWFQGNLRHLLPQASPEFLCCLSTKNFSCETYQILVKVLGQPPVDRHRMQLIYFYFLDPFLNRTDSEVLSCASNSTNSADWLRLVFGPFIRFAPLGEFMRLHRNFSVMDASSLLSPGQLAEFVLFPGELTHPHYVNAILHHMAPGDLAEFFDELSPSVEGLHLPAEVSSALLQQIFDRANLSEASVNDTEAMTWLKQRLGPLLPNMMEGHVAQLFNIVRHRACDVNQDLVGMLETVRQTLSMGTQAAVEQQILKLLKGSAPLRCYRGNSFMEFLRSTFSGFPLPRVTNFLSVVPPSRMDELFNSMEPSELGDYLREPNVIDNGKNLCQIFHHFNQTPEFLEHEDLPDDVRCMVLPCVWSQALRAVDEADVDRWFGSRLRNYLPFINKELLSSPDTFNASCLPFKRLVSIAGNYSRMANFTPEDAYNTIKTYLNSSGSSPKCYNATDPQLSSKNWFVDYIGPFVTYVTVEDLDLIGSDHLKLFADIPANIDLFNFDGAPQDLRDRYTELIFLGNPNYNPLQLPPQFQCGVPGLVYTTLSEMQSVSVLNNLNHSCTYVDPEVSSALASNMQTISANTISALGQESTGLTTSQITAAPPSVIVQSLSTLSTASGWSVGQATTIVQVLISGNYQINTASSLLNLGSLVGGLPTQMISAIPPAEVLNTASDPGFVANMLSAPQIVQQTYVRKIIHADAAPEQLLLNVPDSMAAMIPRTLVSSFPPSGVSNEVLQELNTKKWKPKQAMLFFDTVANGFEEPDNISADVLQGFTCTRIQKFTIVKIRGLIRACRWRPGRSKVILQETQLTCMYNNIRRERPQDFENYHPDMLLYYNYADVEMANCELFFRTAGQADYDVLSDTLSGRKAVMLENAIRCLNITNTALSIGNLVILGKMVCNLNPMYIENSDSFILEKLKDCKDLSDQQINAIENKLITGRTKYGLPATWNTNTLFALDPLPLYLREAFWTFYTMKDTRKFLKVFMRKLRRNKTEKRKLKRFFGELRKGQRFTRAVVTACPESLGNITQVTISDDAFPYGYDANTFTSCLSTEVVIENLASLGEKVDDTDLQLVVLEKLHQGYPGGLSDQTVQILGSISRAATVEQINMWNITKVDTLASLMASSDGTWDTEKSKTIINKYLSYTGNTLGDSELNAIGPNVCSLDVSVLQNIQNESLKNAEPLDTTTCSPDQKKALFSVAKKAFPITFTESPSTMLASYQMIEPYLSGADTEYIKTLSSCNVSMSIDTFVTLDETVVQDLTTNEVKGLLGFNLEDLNTYRNNSVVNSWVTRQYQEDLDTLNINITGGRTATTTSPSTAPALATTTTPTSASGTCNGKTSVVTIAVIISLIATMTTYGCRVEP